MFGTAGKGQTKFRYLWVIDDLSLDDLGGDFQFRLSQYHARQISGHTVEALRHVVAWERPAMEETVGAAIRSKGSQTKSESQPTHRVKSMALSRLFQELVRAQNTPVLADMKQENISFSSAN